MRFLLLLLIPAAATKLCMLSLQSGAFTELCPLVSSTAGIYNPGHDFFHVCVAPSQSEAARNCDRCANASHSYPNVRWLSLSLLQLADRAWRQVGVRVPVPGDERFKWPSKGGKGLSALRPLLGAMFAELVTGSGCGYWGWFDHDVVFGNLTASLVPLLPVPVQQAVDFLTTATYCMNGPLTLVHTQTQIHVLLPEYTAFANLSLAGLGCYEPVRRCCEPTECVLSAMVGLPGWQGMQQPHAVAATSRTHTADRFRMLACSELLRSCNGVDCFSASEGFAALLRRRVVCAGLSLRAPAMAMHVSWRGQFAWKEQLRALMPVQVHELVAAANFRFEGGQLVHAS